MTESPLSWSIWLCSAAQVPSKKGGTEVQPLLPLLRRSHLPARAARRGAHQLSLIFKKVCPATMPPNPGQAVAAVLLLTAVCTAAPLTTSNPTFESCLEAINASRAVLPGSAPYDYARR